MQIKIGEIPYLNCVPFYWKKNISGLLKEHDATWIQGSPKELGNMARRGELDAAPFSLIDSFDFEDHFEPLANIGIAVDRYARSVLLFSKKPMSELNGARIGVDGDSVTSSELLKIILTGKYNVNPNLEQGMAEHFDAHLLIGDNALRAVTDNEVRKLFLYIYDLGEEWYRWQKLPFVFARWMVRKNCPYDVKKGLSKLLLRNIIFYSENPTLAIKEYQSKNAFRYPLAKEYLSEFKYVLHEEEKQSVAFMRDYQIESYIFN